MNSVAVFVFFLLTFTSENNIFKYINPTNLPAVDFSTALSL